MEIYARDVRVDASSAPEIKSHKEWLRKCAAGYQHWWFY